MRIMENSEIRFYLLRKQPQIVVNDGQSLNFSSQALKLLIFLADNGESEYDRQELIRQVYGTEFARDTFRKKVVYPIRKLIPDVLPETSGGDVIRFTCDQVWVDSRIFAEKARDLVRATPGFNKKHYLAAREVLDLYQEAFLLEYHPKPSDLGNDQSFLSWQKNRQRDLTSLYHQLLDQVISFCLKQERYWSEANFYGEQWLHSLNPSAKPLQYLIWLAAHQRSDALTDYLAELREREEAGEQPMGPPWVEWSDLLKRGKLIPLARLLPQSEQSTGDRADDWTDEQIDRKEILEQILSLLTAPREQVFAVVGLPGVGKTELAHTAAQLLRERSPGCKIVLLELTAQLDLELLCNNILNDLGRQDLFTLDYAKKRQRLRQLLQAPNLAIIVDEGHTTHFANVDTLNTVLAILSGARIMVIARELARFDHYVIELPGLDEDQTKSFLVSRVSWLKEIEEVHFKEIADLTRGLPLLLHIIVGGLKKELGRVHSLIAYLKAHNVSPDLNQDVYAIYESILAWLWQYLTSKDKDLLYAISLFAEGDGADNADLNFVLGNPVPDENIQQRLYHLVDMHLVERKVGFSSEARYVLHPIILDFVLRWTQHPRRPHASLIEQAYIRHILDFIGLYHDQVERLDEHKQNIFHMFDLVFLNDDHVWARPQAVEVLRQVFPYFEMRGLHSTASRLITRVLTLGEFESVLQHIQMMRNAAKIAFIRADEEQALRLYEEALVLAEESGCTAALCEFVSRYWATCICRKGD